MSKKTGRRSPAKKTAPYTVVGLYHDNKQVWVGHVDAADPAAAAAAAKRQVAADMKTDEECSRCGGTKEEPGAPQDPELGTALCGRCDGSGIEPPIAVLSVFEGEHRDVYGEDELIED